ncbi:hypothetical protein ADK54_13460 [Streptomyces sp. WM6378]|nr:hypothetical protein ADK54_13460 [Streptomyces sp. WM6378]
MSFAEHLLGSEDVCRELTNRPSKGRVPEADQTASGPAGPAELMMAVERLAWLAVPHRDREVTTLSTRAAEGMVL